ncbi:MAG: GntR family transcriptional regulator [Acidimicrobiia bacterium]
MTNAPVVRSELADGIADQIRDAILAGEYAPGDALPSERELTEQLGANRTTIREGLAQLEHQGLIERRQGARCRVLDYRRTGSIELLPDLVRLSRSPRSSTEPSALASTNEVLRIIYEGALDLAFERITAAEIAQLDELALGVEVAAAAGDVAAVEHANRSFHQGVARATHSIALELLVGSFYRVVDSAAARSGDKKGAVGNTLIELVNRDVRLPQRALADAIAAGKPDEARAVVRRMLGDEQPSRTRRRASGASRVARQERAYAAQVPCAAASDA